MKDFPIRFVLTDEAISPSAGLALVGYLLHQTKRDKRVNALRLPTVRRNVHISHRDVIRTMIGLLATGKEQMLIIWRHFSFLTAAIRRVRSLTSSRLLVLMDAGKDVEANVHT